MKHSRFKLGYTLVESLVALAVFSILSVVIGSIFVSATNLQRTTAELQRVQNDGRYIVEKLAREIRARELAYPLDDNNPQPLLNFQPDEIQKILEISFDRGAGNLMYGFAGEGNSEILNSAAVRVVDASFFVAPTVADVWGDEPTANIQPRVTLRLTLEPRTKRPGRSIKPLTIQTTISSKVYKR